MRAIATAIGALCVLSAVCIGPARPEVLTPPYFNLAQGRRITATATCGDGQQGPELYCKLVGANSERNVDYEGNLVIQGQVCDHCDPSRPDKSHPPEYAVDGQETWWQSPPLSRGMKYNEINLTIDLGQEFHVAYVVVKMGNSPRPGVWVLERSADHGLTYQPWQYFADTMADCELYFGKESIEPISSDDSVICDTSFSKIVPLENGEIFVRLLANRPSANNFFNSYALQEFTRATNVRFRLIRVKNLLGHLMSVARQDPTTTRRYFYSVKDVSIGGRCRCNGHADLCDITDPADSYKLICRCQHNTCGHNCEQCCPGFEQKAWSQSKYDKLFGCEPCNCYGHSETCVYDNATDAAHLSIDIHGKYEGGGVCQNCRDNTKGINCNECDFGYYRPAGKLLNDTNVCQPCDCDKFYSTGNCSEGFGKCECKAAYASPDCDRCSEGYYGYPDCKPCDCYLDGTRGRQCENTGGQCPCKQNFSGKFCYQCAEGFYNFPECKPCQCNDIGSKNSICDQKTGQCLCHNSFGNLSCDQCNHGYFDFPKCSFCNCDLTGSLPEICDKNNGKCLCKEGYAGPRCDKCLPGYNGYPDCKPCGCSEQGSASSICDASGKCPCLPSFSGRTCEQCSPGYYKYPECKSCECSSQGSIGISCDNEGKCKCKPNFMGITCDKCKEGLYNFPICEECNCNPAGVLATFAGCGSLPLGELCQCKERVHGRICDECRELYWNLQPTNPDGCEDCDCFMPGVLSGVGVCNPVSGQCVCKPSATSRRCDECAEGFYSLNENSLFGCTECGCNVGGSVNGKCDKNTGQCFCQPRIVGRACTEPMQAHYFPTLHQFSYEAEDSRTPEYTPVRYGFDEKFFPEYSWKGYAVFSQLQSEIVHELDIDKPSIYRIVLKYVNLNNETIVGLVTVTPETPSHINIEQKFMVQLKPTKTPTFVTVSGATGNIPSPFVMNPGRWAVTIKIEQNLFLDYFVILPAEYYEGDILVDKVLNPCVIDNIEVGLCRHFDYPSISKFNQVKSTSALNLNNEEPVDFFEDEKYLDVLDVPKLPVISESQPELKLKLSIENPGPYVMLVNYMTPSSIQTKAVIEIEIDQKMNSGKVILYACHHTTLCRQAAVDASGKVAIFDIKSLETDVILKGGKDHSVVGIESIVALPLEKWSLDFINPNPSCVKKDGKCIQSFYPTPPDTKKIEFKVGNENRLSTIAPKDIFDNSTSLIILDHEDSIVDLAGKVPSPGAYVFIVHFYQPDFPAFEMKALIHNGQTYEAVLPVKHCPSNSGCRSVVKQANGNTQFQLTENFLLTLKEPNHKSIWLEYVLVVPAQEYSDTIIVEQPFDYTGLFISKCGTNHFYINTSTTGFCKEATFSLTTAYNNGAVSCFCDSDGSLSFLCDPFGGQCQCKPNVIGRRCDACKTGYFGFPDCKSCNCPSAATCETNTGECICPPRVVGKNCDQCEGLTYGFDPIIGCEECKCNNYGVKNGNLQCDLFNGTCQCKENIVGRSCDHCRFGHWSFPRCDLCDCDYRGTTPGICNQDTSECFCKNNVNGQACDLCKDGTFNIQEKNEEGCSKCFCFGKTTRCQSSNLYRTEIIDFENWLLKTVNVTVKPILIEDVKLLIENEDENTLSFDLSSKDLQEKITYFFAPEKFLGNQLKSYGGFLNYSIFYTTNDFGNAISGPDVILYGHETYLFYFSLEQPASNTLFQSSVELVEQNFILPSGLPTTREQIMQVLQNLNGIYIRATYWEPTVILRISNILLESAQEEYIPSKEIALSVEQCQCPTNYVGLSCEECADGSYRAQTGPYGGFCVPCQCNGHSNTCDKVTGKCETCEHNTEGDHCEKCIVGYHGNATVGSPNDCLICACPLPIPSNNFATGCEVSPDGDKISCDCIPGYFGARCESCNSGFFGSPEIPGEVCRECQCSGNIKKDDPGSCDSITGECTGCLNNTFGESCQYCKPGFFGDALSLKDCQSCDCDKCGMEKCDNYDGRCVCQPNVEGEKCDRCAVNHYGFGTCKGCKPCDCALASESTQCDENTGMCRCKPGVAGRTCDRCKPGYWNYTEEGCISCGCNSEYSVGVSCNPQTGHCECLPGVIGDKCDHCPHRWVLIQPEPNLDQTTGVGCFECDTCTHSLLDATDSLFAKLYPVSKEFDTVTLGDFPAQRLSYINKTILNLQPNLTSLIMSTSNPLPLNTNLTDFQKDIEYRNRKSKSALSDALTLASKSNLTVQNAEEMRLAMDEAVSQTTKAVTEIKNLAQNLQEGAGPQIDSALDEAQQVLKETKSIFPNMKDLEDRSKTTLEKSEDLYYKMKEVESPLEIPTRSLQALTSKMKTFQDNISDIEKYSEIAFNKATETNYTNTANKESLTKLNERINSLTKLKDSANNAVDNLLKTVKEALDDFTKSTDAFAKLGTENESILTTKSRVDTEIKKELQLIEDLQKKFETAKTHSDELREQADLMESLVKNSTSASETAIVAANSYKNIVSEIEKSLNAAKNASKAAENSISMSKGLDSRVALTEQNSTKLEQDVRDTLVQIQGSLEESLKNATDEISKILNSKNQLDEKEKEIQKQLDQIKSEDSNVKSDKNVEKILDQDKKSLELIKNLDDLSKSLPNDLKTSRELTKDTENGIKDINQSDNQLEIALKNLPSVIEAANRLKDKKEAIQEKKEEIKFTVDSLRRNVTSCREFLNRINVGRKLSKNSVLELRNPTNLAQESISTHASIYFKTNQSDGLIMYLGNEVGSSLKTRRVKNDDFMALQVQNGYLVLLIDIGSGISTVINNKKNVSDDKWYKATVERTGKAVKLDIVEDVGRDSEFKVYSVQTILPGNFSVLNLDKDHSRLFIGGLHPTFEAQQGIKEVSLDGTVEDLMLGNSVIGLWDFVYSSGENNGSVKRNELKDLDSKNNTSFQMMGEGYFTINSTEFVKINTYIYFNIKTTSPSGLIFLIVNENTNNFMSVELENGNIVYKVKSGGELVTKTSSNLYNDDKWHKIEVTRNGKKFLVKINLNDEKTEDMIGECKGTMDDFQDSKELFFGGYPLNKNISEISKANFDGCLTNINGEGANLKAVTFSKIGVSSGISVGCQDKIINLMSFNASRSYAKWSNAFTSDNLIELILRFNTGNSEGLLVYSDLGSSSFSLRIEAGILIFESGGVEVSSSQQSSRYDPHDLSLSTRYDDGQWHVVFVAHTSSQLILIIDDNVIIKSDRSPKPARLLKGDFYFGGVPSNVSAVASISPSFIGCIGDITFNGLIVDFNELTTEFGVVLGRCKKSPLYRKSPKPPLKDDEDTAPIQYTTRAPVEITTKSTPLKVCTNSPVPLEYTDQNQYSSFRFGNLVGSRFEYDSLIVQSRSKTNVISVEVKTSNTEGIIFYHSTGTDLMAIYLKEGKVYYQVSCNYGPTTSTGQQAINDGKWHTIKWTRSNFNATLFIDDVLVGNSGIMNECELNLDSPFYLGGTDPAEYGRIIASIGMNDTFQGCLREFKVNSKNVGPPDRRYGVTQCSEKVEKGAFFFEKGGSIKLIENFVMGKESQTFKMDIKPRSVNGVLMSLKTSKNYFVLEIKNGTIQFSVESIIGKDPKDPIIVSSTPPYSLCNGEWHTIEATKKKNNVKLGINNKFDDKQIYGKIAHAKQGSPLFIGGDLPQNRNDQSRRYLGCIRNIEIIDNLSNKYNLGKLTPQMIEGNVTLSVCPTI